MVLLGTVHWKVILGTRNGYSMASLQKHPFGNFILKSEGPVMTWLHYARYDVTLHMHGWVVHNKIF